MSAAPLSRIPELFIEEVISKTDLVALIQERLLLKKNGANYIACCPFHKEKSPSFTVSPTKQFYHCFGCQASGNAIRFLMAYDSLSFVVAVGQLAARIGLVVPQDPSTMAQVEAKQFMYEVLHRVARFYREQLKTPPQDAIGYLKKRGITGEVAKVFQLGFAPISWNALYGHFENTPEALRVLEETGLIIRHASGRFYDRFRGRIMFPIRDLHGEIIGFGGRVTGAEQPKYLNSPESLLFQKRTCLCGVYESVLSKVQRAIVVEGYFDVITLAQYGIAGAVATLGTAIGNLHVERLWKSVPEIIFCFDGDLAGQQAAWKALCLVLASFVEGKQVRFVFLPEGSDPDSYVRSYGAQALEALLQKGMTLSEYFFSALCSKIKPDSVDNRARLASMARPMIETIPSGTFKEMMYEQLATYLSSTSQTMKGQKTFRTFYKGRSSWVPSPPLPPPPQPMETAYIASALLVEDPKRYQDLQEGSALRFMAPGMGILAVLLQVLAQDPKASSGTLRQALQDSGQDLKRFQASERKLALIPHGSREAEWKGALMALRHIENKQITEQLLAKAKHGVLSEEEKQILKEALQAH